MKLITVNLAVKNRDVNQLLPLKGASECVADNSNGKIHWNDRVISRLVWSSCKTNVNLLKKKTEFCHLQILSYLVNKTLCNTQIELIDLKQILKTRFEIISSVHGISGVLAW